jgi:hypothetical protein
LPLVQINVDEEKYFFNRVVQFIQIDGDDFVIQAIVATLIAFTVVATMP